MPPMLSVSDVLTSEVRQSILKQLDGKGSPKTELRDRIAASDAAVYQEINRLTESAFIRDTNDGWALTGRGYLARSILQVQAQTDSLLERDLEDDYWRTHDPSIIPEPFQAMFNILADCQVIRASDRDTAMWRVAEQLDAANRVDLVGIVYNLEIGMALDRAIERGAAVRILADSTLVDEVLRKRSNFSWEPDDVEIRVADVEFALGVTDDVVGISLPYLDGNFDLQTVLLSDTPMARKWGDLLFTCFWQDATPIDEYLPAGETLAVFDPERSPSLARENRKKDVLGF